jgi:GNAT superfamily N-acetyltransferase
MITIHRLSKITENKELYSFFLKQLAELIDLELAYPMISWTDDDGAVYATIDDTIVGCVIFNIGGPSKDPNIFWISLTGVDKEYRKQGIMTQLHVEAEQLAKENNCTIVSSLIHRNNQAGLKSAMKMGRYPIYHYTYKKL